MSNLAKLEFVALDITGKNFLSWILDAEIHLDANGLGNTIKEKNTTSIQEKAKAMIFLRRHLHEGLKAEYLTIKDPLVLWNGLKEMESVLNYSYVEKKLLMRICWRKHSQLFMHPMCSCSSNIVKKALGNILN